VASRLPNAALATLWANSRRSSGWRASLFAQQRAFIEDKAKRKAALCGRRSGKSEGIAFDAYDTLSANPGTLSVYVALTKNNARETLLSKLVRQSKAFDWGLRFGERDGQLMVWHPNGARLWLAGCKDRSECEKFRGADQGFRKVWVDEAQSYGSYLEYLVEEVFDAALADQDGDLVMTGTPSPVPAGYFYEVTTGDRGRARIPVHSWTMLDNPYMPSREQRWADAKGRLHDEKFRREYMAQWVLDERSQVYPYDASRNTLDGCWDASGSLAVVGLDPGYVDATAWATVAWQPGQPLYYVPESSQRTGQIPSAVAAQTEAWRRKLLDQGYRVTSIVCDEGGLGKGYASEMRERYGIPVEPAAKSEKRAAIEMLRGDILSGTIKVDPWRNRDLIDQWQRLVWNEDHSDVEDGTPDHIADAVLYAHRKARAYYRPQETEPELTADLIARREKEAVAKRQRMKLNQKRY
jgi:hypothetical protein